MRVHHLALGSNEPARLARFYAEIFELEEVARHDDDAGELRSVWLALDDGVLMIERTVRERPRVEGVDAGLFLLAFAVDDDARREALEARLEGAGAPIEERTAYTSYARDPDGNRVAVSSYPLPPQP